MAQEKDESRRGFLKQTATVLTTTVSAQTLAAAPQTATAPKPLDVVAALGDVIIPTDGAMYPGYKRLEANGISARVLDQLRRLDRVTPADLSLLNDSARSFTGKTLLESDERGRVSYIEALFMPAESVQTTLDAGTIKSLQRILKLARDRILTVFYLPERRGRPRRKWRTDSQQAPRDLRPEKGQSGDRVGHRGIPGAAELGGRRGATKPL
jgi:hypothetical protein